ncbi:MAG TPA: bacterial transcriptional activator domain-containing protein [Gemmatimonadales bacterium]|nr:bacterial transcriptional activator domain-containing protein [Gemmatimonadales bacterium]
MLELRTLGVLDLHGPAGTDCGAILRQPKRLALLAYLAASAPRRFHRRDTLLGVFWPELDAGHARAALRRALYFLRKGLGEGVVVGRGEEEVAIAEEPLWCDAAAFDEAIAAGRPAEALALYRGELLHGFHLAGVPEFERWLDGERATRRAQASRAAWTLADTSERAGETADAVRWARHAAALTPYDEAALRRLVAALDRLGERPAALRAYDEFAQRLAAEYELEPSAETRAAVEAIRQGPRPAPAPASAAATKPPAPASPPPAPAAPVLTPPPPTRTADPAVLAVLPFEVRAGAHLGYLAHGMVDLLSTKLDGAGALRTVDPRALLAYRAEAGSGPLDPTASAALAARFGAGRVLAGAVVEAGGRLQLSATLYDDAGAPLARAVVEGESEGALFTMVDDLARQLLVGDAQGPHARLTQLAGRTTGSLAALKAWLEGERHFRLSRYFEAIDCYQRAVGEDPAFALAHYRLAAALAASAMPEPARAAAAEAFAHRERLSAHARLLLDAQRAWLHGQVAEAEALYTTIVGTYPDDMEAWFLLGDLLFHGNAMRGRPCTEAQSAFLRTLAFEPGHVSARGHLARIAALEGETAAVEAHVAKLLAVSPASDQALGMRALRAAVRGDAAERRRTTDELLHARVLTAAIAFSDVALYANDLAGAEEIAERFTAEVRAPELQALCRTMLAHLALARGRRRAAETALAAAEALDPVQSLLTRGLFATLPFVPYAADALEALRAQLAAWPAAATPPSHQLALALHNGLHAHFRAYLLAHLSARLGDLRALDRWGEELARLPAPAQGTTLVWNLARSVAAQRHRLRGDAAGALEALARSRLETWFQLTVASPFYAQAGERFLRAELLAELGRDDEALGWYRSLVERSPFELVFRAPAHRRQAALHERAGRAEDAARHRAVADALWRDGELVPPE